ncbi:alpha/beta hydrolase [Echinicola soli]|uniref:Alpha/beta hydrolase n=1 Tax=Echinicola soli TaxID=2591634 RepID=A0A514CGW1_9BACT|nr:alpha/beta hydrolase [Echinicola soli]QDH78904.1 alpha/beta hydrolase [Echinicola soli]
MCQGKGEYYLDNLQLTIKGKENAPTLVNGTFEDLDSGLSAFMSLNKEDSVALAKEQNQENNHILRLIVNGGSTAIGSNNKVGKQVEANGVNLYYETYGEGEPLLLLHGADMSIASFSSIIPILAKHYKIIALDTRGHGQSTEDGKKLTYELYAEDVNAFLDDLGLKAVNVLGWSDGGNTALILAMDYPDKVNCLAAMSAVLYNDNTAVDTKINKTLKKQIKELESRTQNEREEFSLRVKKSLRSEPNISPSSLSKVSCPTLIMAGEHDYVKEAHTRLIAENIPDATLNIVDGAGHNAPAEIPQRFSEMVINFFKERTEFS